MLPLREAPGAVAGGDERMTCVEDNRSRALFVPHDDPVDMLVMTLSLTTGAHGILYIAGGVVINLAIRYAVAMAPAWITRRRS